MAVVTLDRGYVHLASNLADYIRIPLAADAKMAPFAATYVAMASGRIRQRNQVRPPRTMQLTTDFVPRATIDWLELNAGKLVYAREPRGLNLYCSYLVAPVTEMLVQNLGDRMQLTFTEVTYQAVV